MSTPPLLEVSDLSVDYDLRGNRVEALRNITFHVNPGEVVALVGESGSGKTTIARAVIGMLPENARITSGRIRFEGRDLTGLEESAYRAIRGRRLGWIPQDPMVALNPLHRVGRQVSEPLIVHGLAQGRAAAVQAVQLLERVGIPQPELRAAQFPHELSGGMRQRVLIAGALAADPALILADEPTTALDVTVQKRILDDIGRLTRERGISVLIITHDLAMAAERADRIIVLERGRLVEQGGARQILRDPQGSYTRQLIAAVPDISAGRLRAPARAGATDPAESRRDKISPDTGTAKTATLASGTPETGNAPLLEVSGISRSFALTGAGGKSHVLKAVEAVSFTLHPGQTFGLVGESGSGKSTLARIILGLERSDSGSLRFDGRPVTRQTRAERRRLNQLIQPIYQNPYASLDPRMTVAELIAEPLLGFGIGDRRWRETRIRNLIDHVQLPSGMALRRSSELSGGQRQRVAIARALAAEPQLIICDEPVSALDVSIQAQVLRLLAELQAEHRLSYVFISHDLAVIRQVSDQVGVMKEGRLVESGLADQIFAAPRHEYTRLLLASIPGQSERAA